jgi:uncharacterized membrane protein
MLSRLLHRRDERGAIILLAAVGVVVAMIAGGLAVDLGTLSVETRTDQQIADLAALDGVRALPNNPTSAVQASATRNKFPYTSPGYQLTPMWNDVTTGLFGTDPTKLATATMVRVIAKSPHAKVFAFSTVASSGVNRTATAALGNPAPCPPMPYVCVTSDGSPIGTVRVGSSAASLTTADSTILNKLFANTVGGGAGTTLVGWQGLASGNVKFSRLRTALGYSAGTADTVLDANLTYRQLLDATVSALNADGSPSSLTAATFLGTLASQVSATAGATVTLRHLLNIVGNVGGGADVADATINVKDIVVGGMTLADTDHFASFNLTAADIPGLPGTSVNVKFGLIQSPQEKSGPPKDASGNYRTVASTEQLRLQLTLNIPISILNALSGVLATLSVANLNLSVPYYVTGAGATASLDTMTCAAGNDVPTSVDIFGQTTLATSNLGVVSDAALSNTTTTPTISAAGNMGGANLSVTVLGITTGVSISVLENGVISVSYPGHSGHVLFNPPYDGATSKPVPGTTSLTLPSTVVQNGATAGFTLNVSGLGASLVNITTLQNDILAQIGPTGAALGALNSVLIGPLQRALGLSLANGDIWAPPAQHCNPVSYNVSGPGTPAPLVPSLVS